MGRYVVTGGAGFIGSNLVKDLVADGHDVVVVDSMQTGSRDLLKGLDVEVYEMKLHEFYETRKWKGIDGIYHLGKPSSSPMYRDDRWRMVEAIQGSVAALEIAKEEGVKLVAASTSSVYSGVKPPHREDVHLDPTDFYTEPRIFEERIAAVYERLYGVKWAEMRFFSVYGPGEERKGRYANLVTQFLWAALMGESPLIYGDGEQRRDFVYVKDVVDALKLAMKSDKSGVYNVGTGRSYSLNEMIKVLGDVLGLEIRPRYIPNPVKNYVMETEADLTKARAELGFEPKVGLRDGIVMIKGYYEPMIRAGFRPQLSW